MNNSCIYNGKVIHKRFKPKEHYFKYSVFSLLIDLSELRKIDQEISFFSLNKFNLISFHEKDHGERDGSSLEEWVKKNLEEKLLEAKRLKTFKSIMNFLDTRVELDLMGWENTDIFAHK